MSWPGASGFICSTCDPARPAVLVVDHASCCEACAVDRMIATDFPLCRACGHWFAEADGLCGFCADEALRRERDRRRTT